MTRVNSVCCDGGTAVKEMLTERFQYGCDDDAVLLSALVEVTTCEVCGDQWTGEQGEIARQHAVDQHLQSQLPVK